VALLQEPRSGDVVGMHVRLECPKQLEAELVDQRGIASRLVEYRVDEQRLTARRVGEQIRVC